MKRSPLISRFYFRLLVPTVLINMVSSVGAFFDTILVGHFLGETALVAITFNSPLFMVINTVAALISIGCMNEAGRLAGTGDASAISRYFTLALRVLLAVGVVLSAAGLLLIDPLVRLLGASGALFSPTKAYAIYIVGGTVVFLVNVLLGFFVRMDGNPNLAMTAILLSIGINIALDVVFIVPCHMGPDGAALALVVSQVVSILIMCGHFLKKQHTLSLVRSVHWHDLAGVCKSGVGTASTFVYRAVALTLLNNMIFRLTGQTGMEAYVVVYNVSLIAMTFFEGVSQTVQPFVSAYHGEKNAGCKRISLRLGLLSGLCLCAAVILPLEIFPGAMCALFGMTGPEILMHAGTAVRVYAPAIVLMTVNVMMGYYYQAVGREKLTLLIVPLRELVLLIGGILLCEKAFGLDGMWLGYSLCEGLTLCVWALTARRIGHGDLLLLREDSGGFLAEESTPEALRQRLADSPLTPAERDRVGAVLDESAAVLAKNKTTQLFARREGTQTVAYLSGDAAAPQASALPDTAAQPCDLLGIHRTVLRITMREEA